MWWRFGRHWRGRQDAIALTLESLRPDIVGLQEVWATDTMSQADVLGDHLGMYAAYTGPSLPPPPRPPETPDQQGVELGIAVLSRWPVEDVVVHQLPSSHRHEAPVALVASVDHRLGPLHVLVAAVEYAPGFADDHLAQTRKLAEVMSDRELDGPLPVLLTADLNAPPDSPLLQPLWRVAVDTWVEGGGAPDTATLSSENPLAPRDAPGQIDERVDYVLARPGKGDSTVEVHRAFVAGDRPLEGSYPSDHYATVADLGI